MTAMPRTLQANAPDKSIVELMCHFAVDAIHRERTVQFLVDHPDVVPVLHEAYPVLERLFGKRVPVVLELAHSPEEGLFGPLFINIYSQEPWEVSLHKLDQFDETWWADLPATLRCLLNTDVRCL